MVSYMLNNPQAVYLVPTLVIFVLFYDKTLSPVLKYLLVRANVRGLSILCWFVRTLFHGWLFCRQFITLLNVCWVVNLWIKGNPRNPRPSNAHEQWWFHIIYCILLRNIYQILHDTHTCWEAVGGRAMTAFANDLIL